MEGYKTTKSKEGGHGFSDWPRQKRHQASLWNADSWAPDPGVGREGPGWGPGTCISKHHPPVTLTQNRLKDTDKPQHGRCSTTWREFTMCYKVYRMNQETMYSSSRFWLNMHIHIFMYLYIYKYIFNQSWIDLPECASRHCRPVRYTILSFSPSFSLVLLF